MASHRGAGIGSIVKVAHVGADSGSVQLVQMDSRLVTGMAGLFQETLKLTDIPKIARDRVGRSVFFSDQVFSKLFDMCFQGITPLISMYRRCLWMSRRPPVKIHKSEFSRPEFGDVLFLKTMHGFGI